MYEYDIWSYGPRKISPTRIQTNFILTKSDVGKEFSCKDKQGNLIAFIITNFTARNYHVTEPWVDVEARRYDNQPRVRAISWRASKGKKKNATK